MTMVRDYSMTYNPEIDGVIDVSNPVICENSIEYLKDLKQYVEERGRQFILLHRLYLLTLLSATMKILTN